MKKYDLYTELLNQGFRPIDDEFGDVLRKDYRREVEVLWYGKMDSYMIVKARFSLDHSVVQVSYYDDCVPKSAFKNKTHLSEKRAFNAIKQTVENHGFEF